MSDSQRTPEAVSPTEPATPHADLSDAGQQRRHAMLGILRQELWRRRRRRKLARSAAAAAVLLLAGGLAVILIRGGSEGGRSSPAESPGSTRAQHENELKEPAHHAPANPAHSLTMHTPALARIAIVDTDPTITTRLAEAGGSTPRVRLIDDGELLSTLEEAGDGERFGLVRLAGRAGAMVVCQFCREDDDSAPAWLRELQRAWDRPPSAARRG